MSYYKYAERDAAAEVNWAEIGKNISQTLQDEVKVREEKKDAIDAATREYDNVLNTSPQGEFQGGNKFINDYVASQQKIRMMDDQLLKSGQMDLKNYTTRRQNGIDGTKQLFDLQTKFQEVYSERLKGIMDGSLTAQNAFEMSQVQAFGDFSKSQAVINNVDGRVSVGMTEMGEDGIKRIVPNSAIPTSVLLGKMGTSLPSFDVNAETKRLVDSQGELVFSLFKAGTIAGAGSITELTGVDAIEKFGKGEWTEAANQMNTAIKESVNMMLANPRNLPSLLTGQIGGYSAESFTYNKDEAAKDKNKILLKASSDLGPGVMDVDGPNYKEQKAKAESWLTTSIKSQMDAKVGKSATAQAQLQESTETQERVKAKYRPKVKDDDDTKTEAAGAWNQLFTGKTAAEKRAAAEILLGTPNAIKNKLQAVDLNSVPGSVVLKYEDSSKNRTIPMKGNTLFDFSSQGVELHGVVDRKKAYNAGGGGKGYGDISDFSGIVAERQGKIEFPVDIVSKPSQEAVINIQSVLPEGFTAKDTGGRFGNTVVITAPNKKQYVLETKKVGEAAGTAVIGLEDFVTANKAAKGTTSGTASQTTQSRIGGY